MADCFLLSAYLDFHIVPKLKLTSLFKGILFQNFLLYTSKLLREEGWDEKFARVAELHTGAGLTAQEIEAQNLPLPHRDFLPATMLEKLICYADKFYSKGGSMERKPLDKVVKGMKKFGSATAQRFSELHKLFV